MFLQKLGNTNDISNCSFNLFQHKSQVVFDSIQGYEDLKRVIGRALESEENVNILLHFCKDAHVFFGTTTTSVFNHSLGRHIWAPDLPNFDGRPSTLLIVTSHLLPVNSHQSPLSGCSHI